MKFLLDTHLLLWAGVAETATSKRSLPVAARALIMGKANEGLSAGDPGSQAAPRGRSQVQVPFAMIQKAGMSPYRPGPRSSNRFSSTGIEPPGAA